MGKHNSKDWQHTAKNSFPPGRFAKIHFHPVAPPKFNFARVLPKIHFRLAALPKSILARVLTQRTLVSYGLRGATPWTPPPPP